MAAILSYTVMRGTKPGPFFVLSDGKYLTRDRLVKVIRDGLSSAGINSADYAGHSFRIGAATTAAQRGIQDSTINVGSLAKLSIHAIYSYPQSDSLCHFQGFGESNQVNLVMLLF